MPLTYSISPAVAYTVLGMNSGISTKTVIVSSFDLEDRGLHKIMLTATPSAGVSVSVSFDVDLIDICMTTTFID